MNYSKVLSTILVTALMQPAACYTFLGNSLSLNHETSTISTRSNLVMKISKGKSKHGKGNSIHTLNQQRKRLAGRPGTKYYMDPNKVFIGNLPFDASVDDVKKFLTQQLGNLHNVESVKIISDWKTNKSKGFGFIQFMDPIYATSAMEIIKGKKLKGRVIRLDQGKKKDDDKNRVLFVKKRERKDEDEDIETEDSVIDGALDEVEAMEGEELQRFTVNDFDNEDDSLLFNDDDDEDDEDDELDGWFEEIYGGSKWEELSEEEAKNMNRAQRREAQRAKPKKKLPHKGFGDYVPKTPPPEMPEM